VALDSLNLKPYDRQLQALLQEEYSFYQSLYILLDKQRDFIKYEKDDHLLDLYAEIERCQRRIKESEEKITALRGHDPAKFTGAIANADIKKLVNSITTLVKKNIEIVNDNDAIVRSRHDRIKGELEDLRTSAKIMRYLGTAESSPQFVDGKT
jgi:superfamily I DNA/RNA helicase